MATRHINCGMYGVCFFLLFCLNVSSVQAAQSGAWVLFEDLPLARGDVLTAITRLHEDRHIVTDASGTPVAVDDNFRMFATIRYDSFNV
jgi:midasin (ATPase involved in ribosome maturation)